MTLLRRVLAGGTGRRDQFYREGVPPLSSMPWAAGGGVSQETAVRVIAVQACVSLLADTVATLPVGTFVRSAGARLPVGRPDWLDTPVPSDPSVTRIDHFSQVMWSLGLDGNSFTLALPNVLDPAELRVIAPWRVECRTTASKLPVYRIQLDDGREDVGPDQMVHVARARRPGDLRGLSPVDEAADTLGMKKAMQEFGERAFRNGVFLSGTVNVPGPLAPDALTQLKEEFAANYAGPSNAMKPGVLANGAKWEVPQLNLQDWQLLELHKWVTVEVARLYRVPPALLGVTEPGAVSYASAEMQGDVFEKHTIRPYVERIEAAYQRLIPGAETFLKFNTEGLLRADFKTRMEGYHFALTDKWRTVDEIRALENLPAFGGKDGGLLETPNNNAPGAPA